MRFWVTVAVVLLLDQVTKYLVIANMFVGQSIPLIAGIINITYVQNPGAAFGMLAGKWWVFLISAVIVIVVLTYYHFAYSPIKVISYAIALIVAGSIGNLIDRLRFNYVIDFFDLGWWPVFNIADVAIVVGGTIFIVYLFVERGDD